ncbi:tail fiber domain-containing protein [Chryseolinea sp. T2]|uniref:tail fiber domain-containing protein n=1 Tax=Chryseolinea sp. T2 TaxID=3129255 RepID=UPI003076975E
MKWTSALLLATLTVSANLVAQPTRYGTNAGFWGIKGSYFGESAGQTATLTSSENSFFGAFSGRLTTGNQNTGLGANTLFSNTTGGANAATGFESLYDNTTGSFNTANGYLSMHSNTTGKDNAALGASSLYSNTSGIENTAIGSFALSVNKTGNNNTATGNKALNSNTASNNTANGSLALQFNTSGDGNTAVGFGSLNANITGSNNTAVGLSAAFANSRGQFNTAIGRRTLANNSTGSYNTALGNSAGPDKDTYENTTSLGNGAITTFSNSVRIGNSSVTSIGGAVGWSVVSDGRFKVNVKEDVSGLDFINQLRPVSYELDRAALRRFLNVPDDGSQLTNVKAAPSRQTGFIAQEVEQLVKKSGYVFSGVESPQNENDHYSIRYDDFVVPLVKAVQELTSKMNEQQQILEEQTLEISALKEKLGAYNGTSGDASELKATLFQNTPNPFSLDTEIKMALPETTRQAELIVYNMEGKQLKTFQVTQRGNSSIKLSAGEFSAGMYLYALIVDGKVVDTKRLILTK